MEVIDPKFLFEMFPYKMFYVGFLRSDSAWFPLCAVSNPQEAVGLDSLFVSRSYNAMDELLKSYAGKIPQVRQTLIQYLMKEEIENLMRSYGLKSISLTHIDEDHAGCSCGCGCG